ncbi:endoplasmic reticulum lectin 1-like protein [Plakobranchus ocellatus]|uniref:Endoplasmic reticulum lectin 1 n=1 Tax=Plakobranchus ocellatus TaxID=259542 RepID=A0AAV4A9T6_9GAST|nr:endoplasmic reticulum lectin 1-like protein [Plakobranchus ocellatus]
MDSKQVMAFIRLLWIQILSIAVFVKGNTFDPFMDSNLYAISWMGPLDLNQNEISDLGDRHLVVTTDKRETYRCILPETDTTESDKATKYDGPDVDEVIRPLFSQPHCSYRIESYWTYELCHGKSLKQYHETREQGSKPKVQEYFLGLGNSRTTAKEQKSATLKVRSEVDGTVKETILNNAFDQQSSEGVEEGKSSSLPVREIDGIQLPYYEVVMDGGTRCDLTGKPRKSRVLYICHSEGRGEIYEFKESSTCEYEVLVLSALLCKHPDYRPKTQPVSKIRCHAMVGSPLRPSSLSQVEYEVKHLQTASQHFRTTEDTLDQSEDQRTSKFFHKTKADEEAAAVIKAQEDHQSVLSSLTDKQTLRNILSGSQCLRGGTGWWKHEVCIGKFAKQFHKDKQVDATIHLGYWNKEKHLQWLQDNPSRRPRAAQDRKLVSLFYSGGDVCDLTGKSRTCEVRLKCLQNIKNTHAVILSLAEPSTCQYVLTVESALFCDVLKHADENGLFDNINL